MKSHRLFRKVLIVLPVLFSCINIVFAETCDSDGSTCQPVDRHSHKQFINPHELDNCKVRFASKAIDTKRVTFGGLLQADYMYVRTDDRSTAGKVNDPFETSDFRMQRVRFDVTADMGNCWYGNLELDLFAKINNECTSEAGSLVPVVIINDDPEGENLIPPANQQPLDTDDINATQCIGPCGDPGSGPSKERINAEACNQSLSNRYFTLNKAYIEKIYEGNSFKVGYKKVNFGVEENTKVSKLATIERSMVTNYFAGFMGRLPCRASAQCGDSRLGIGNRHVGVFMDGEYHGFGYGVALVNGFQGLGVSSKFGNEVGIYGNAYYDTSLNGFDLKLGVNVGYQPEGNTNWMATQGRHVALANQGRPAVASDHPVSPVRSSIIGWNPYLKLKWKKLSVLAEVLGSRVENGVINVSNQVSGNAKPLGYNIVSSYQCNERWELVKRFSHLDTDERGVRIGNVVPGGNNVLGVAPAPLTNIFNEVTAYYVGLNYYIKNKAVKLALGYEHLDFHGRWGSNLRIPSRVAGLLPSLAAGQGKSFGGDKAKLDAVRARVQVIF